MNIKTVYDPKPIPDRRFDWTAFNAEYEPGDSIGFGATEEEAIADYKQKLLMPEEEKLE